LTSKLYVKYLISVLVIFILFHFITWNLITKNIFGNDENIYIGDLGRLSYSIDSLYPRKNESSLKQVYKVFMDYSQTDVITIGDSFSRGDSGGKNANYQDFIATNYNLDVLNISPSDKGYIETVLMLISSGVLDLLKPKAIILESVERSAIQRFSNPIDWSVHGELDELLAKSPDKFIPHTPDASFVNHNNYMAWIYRILYRYYDNALLSKVYKVQLTHDFFTSREKRTLLYLSRDLDGIRKSNIHSISLLNENLNHLQAILENKGIQLYFLPAADKYNIYSKYIIDNKYAESNFFEILREKNKNYHLIDTKLILQKLTDNGVQDVYYSDDTHWTDKASAEIVNYFEFSVAHEN